MDATVSNVDLEQVFEDVVPEATEDAGDAMRLKLKSYRGVFGLSLTGEVVLYGVLSLVGLAFGLLCLVTLFWQNFEHFWPYVVGFVLVAPYSWLKLRSRWALFSQGRGIMRTLSETLGGEQA